MMNPTDPHSKAPLPQRWELGSGWFLMVCAGGTYETDIVRGTQLADAWEVVCWGEVGAAPEEDRRAAEARLTDPDRWLHDGDNGPTRYTEAVGETDRLQFFRLESLSLIGALASSPDVPDPAPECPMQHVLHPDCAGTDPVLLFAELPARLKRLAYP